MPRLANDALDTAAVLALEPSIGGAVGNLNLAIVSFPRSANSCTEHLDDSLVRELMLPSDIAEAFASQRRQLVEQLADLPLQLIHGNLRQENALLPRPGIVSGFIDFDHLPMAPRVCNIVEYRSRRIRLRWRDSSPGARGRLCDLPGFLLGYHRANPLTLAENAALPAAIAAGNLGVASYHRQVLDGTLPCRRLPDHEAVLADTVGAARWLLAHEVEVATVILNSLA